MKIQGQARTERKHSSSQYAALAILALVCCLSACGGSSSNNNPVPTISSLSPDHATFGGPGFTLTVNGSDFVSHSVVNWNGSARQTTFVNSGQLTASISAGDIAAAGNAQVTVSSPSPGGGTSSALVFAIIGAGPTINILSLSTADLLYDSIGTPNNWIYASVPANAAHGSAHTITAINPAAGTVLPSPIDVTDDPGRLALSDDGQFLYFGLNSAPSVRRLNLAVDPPVLDPAIISLGDPGWRVETLQVLQYQPNSIAVARKLSNPLPGNPRNAGVAIYDVPVGMRPITTPAGSSPNVIQLCTDPAVVFGLNVGDGPSPGFYVMDIDSNGVSAVNYSVELTGNDISLGVIPNSSPLVEKMFSTSGQVLQVLPNLPIIHNFSLTGLVKADTALGRVFYLVQNPPPSATTWTIHAFKIDDYSATGTADIPGVNGTPSSLIRWGSDGLAFRTDSGQVFLIRSSLVAP